MPPRQLCQPVDWHLRSYGPAVLSPNHFAASDPIAGWDSPDLRICSEV
jgi:hypothetical protein